jgi:hypothetical protein
MSANDAVDGASSAASKCYSSCVGSARNKGGEATVNVEGGALKELARTRRRNADKVDPGIGRTRLGRTLKCALTIGTRSAQSIMASGFTAAQTGRTHDRIRPMLQLRQKVLAKAPHIGMAESIGQGRFGCSLFSEHKLSPTSASVTVMTVEIFKGRSSVFVQWVTLLCCTALQMIRSLSASCEAAILEDAVRDQYFAATREIH